jgi:hypothetical protein
MLGGGQHFGSWHLDVLYDATIILNNLILDNKASLLRSGPCYFITVVKYRSLFGKTGSLR